MAQRPGYSILVCPDSVLLREEIDNLLAAHENYVKEVYWGDEEPPPKFWEGLALEGLFEKPKAIVVRQAQNWNLAVWKKISKVLGRGPALAWPIFCLEVAFERGAPKIPGHLARLGCFGFAAQKGWLWKKEGLTERTISAYIARRAKNLGLAFERDALAHLSAVLPADAGAIDNELNRLKLQANDGRVTEKMATATGYGPECNIFALIRLIEAGKLEGTIEEAGRASSAESLLFPLLSLLARDLRKLWQCRAGEDAHFYPAEAAAKKALSRKMGFTGLSMAFSMLADCELQVKSGRLNVAQALDQLLIGLCRLFGGKIRIE